MSDINYWSTRPCNDDDPVKLNRIIDLTRVEDIGAEPVTLAEAKTQLRVTFSDDDTEITALITKARKHLENYLNISIVYQRIQLIAEMVREWQLPYSPVIGIESVADSQANTGSGPVTWETAENWSQDAGLYNPNGAYRQRIIYTAGYTTCPYDLKDCILQVVTFLYENRGAVSDIAELQKVMSNADRYKVMLWI